MTVDTSARKSLGIALMLGFVSIAPVIDVFSKLAAQTLPVGQVTAARYVVQAAVLLLVLILFRLSWDFRPSQVPALLLAGFLSLGSTYCFVLAIRTMEIADALAIVFIEPFLLLLIGHFFFSHPIGWRRFLASVVGFIGVLVIIRPNYEEVGAVALLPLATAVFFALYMLEMRRLSQSINPVALQFQVALAGAVIAVPFLIVMHKTELWPGMSLAWPEGIAWLWILAIGASSSVSHLLLTHALKNATATVLAPLHYLEQVSATLFGLAVFGDFPEPIEFLGIAMVIGAGLYAIHRERLATAQEPPAATPTAAG